jgi:hypothetical protein
MDADVNVMTVTGRNFVSHFEFIDVVCLCKALKADSYLNNIKQEHPCGTYEAYFPGALISSPADLLVVFLLFYFISVKTLLLNPTSVKGRKFRPLQ